jgi:SAM-dependent methyltransferase
MCSAVAGSDNRFGRLSQSVAAFLSSNDRERAWFSYGSTIGPQLKGELPMALATKSMKRRATAHLCLLFALVVFGVTNGVLSAGPEAQQPQHGGRHMEHRFDDAEKWARNFDDPARDQWQLPSRVVDTLAVRPGQVVADIGAGTGYFSVRLARAAAGAKVYAVDIEPSMVEYVRKRAEKEGLKNIVAVKAGSDRTNLPEPIDLALIVDTFHHIPARVAYFSELRKSLKPGGRVAIVDFKKGAPDGPPEEFRFTPEQIGDELGQAGFVLSARHDFLPRQNFLIYRVR